MPVLKAKKNKRERKQKQEAIEELKKEELVRLNAQIPVSLHRKVKVFSANSGVSMTEIIKKSLAEYLSKDSNIK